MAHLLQAYSANLAPLLIGDLEPRSNNIPYLGHAQEQFVGYPDVENALRGATAAGVTVTAAEAATIVAAVLDGDMRLATIVAAAAGITTTAQALVVLNYLAPQFVETGVFTQSYESGVIYGYRQSNVWVSGVATGAALTILQDNLDDTAWTP